MAVSEPPSEFDYLWEELAEPEEEEFGSDDDDVDPHEHQHRPWYRTVAAMLAIAAITGAVIAILVSAVLLISRDTPGPVDDGETTIAPTPSSVSATTPPTSAVPPSPIDSPSPSEPSPSAPVVVEPTNAPSPTKSPEIGVTRTPETRSQISVSPQPRTPHPGFPRN